MLFVMLTLGKIQAACNQVLVIGTKTKARNKKKTKDEEEKDKGKYIKTGEQPQGMHRPEGTHWYN